MFYNPCVFPALIAGLVLFQSGLFLSGTTTNYPAYKRVFLVIGLFLVGLPGLSFVFYYFHLFSEPVWYYQFRSLQCIELLSSLPAILFGYLTTIVIQKIKVHKSKIRLLLFVATLFLVFIPFAKPILLPVRMLGNLDDFRWKDGVCLQSVATTCGPASLATILTRQGIEVTEKELARKSFTSATGTENWYLGRAARGYGCEVTYLQLDSIDDVPIPSIIGVVTKGGYGHFVAVIQREDDQLIIGDPLVGAYMVTTENYTKRFAEFTGFAMRIH